MKVKDRGQQMVNDGGRNFGALDHHGPITGMIAACAVNGAQL
jgi:hypothetical protein